MTDDMHRYMTELGSSSTPEPDPRFVTNLELQLRESRADATTHRFARPRRWPATVAAVTFSVAVVAFGLATIDTSPQIVSISAASGAEVRMPDGQVVVATPGLELPNGAVVEVGPAGSARIGDIDVGPLQAAEVTAEGIIVAGDGLDGPIRLSTTSIVSEVSAISSQVSVDAPTTARTPPDDAGRTGTAGSSDNSENPSSSSEPVSTSTLESVTTDVAPSTSSPVEDSTPVTSSTSGVISATSIVRNDSTTTTEATSTTSGGGTTVTTSSSSTTTASTSTSAPTSTSTSEPPADSTTTTTEHGDPTTTSTSSSTTTTEPGSTSTTTTAYPTSTTSTTEPTFLKIIGELRFERPSCQLDTKTLVSLVYAIATDSVSPGQSTLLTNCLGASQ